jgi:hypothetical protein
VAKDNNQADGFLGRWARRKNDALQGKPLDEPVLAKTQVPAAAGTTLSSAASLPTLSPADARPDAATNAATNAETNAETAEPAKPLSLDDVQGLTKDSDFKPFMSRGVEPSVRNAAMKKLFADPHFNVMDRMDIYIDDYSQPDPLPLSMLRQMASAKFLKLFDEEEEKDSAVAAPARESADSPAQDSVAQSAPTTDASAAQAVPPSVETDSPPEAPLLSGLPQEDHAHIDLRLQPDHAPERPEPGRDAA